MNRSIPFKRFGTMLDCSRNAVTNLTSLKRWIDITSDLGYNTLLLYTEDTYEVDDNPYFGYMRGRFTQAELAEADGYARSKGMELIPCIQTLAHLNAITRWPEYASHIDAYDILLAGDERVYELIDSMFASLSKCFTTKTVNIGMDEAHMIGRGRYFDLHGDTDRFKILTDHLKRVAEIGAKYGFTLCMWSDMFFRLATGGSYTDTHGISEEVASNIPENVKLIYWDYYSSDKDHYDAMFSAHKRIKEGTWFAGGLWRWTGFAPHNGYSIKASKAALSSCIENGVDEVFLTMWGDDGGECSCFSLLPSLFYASEIAKGNSDTELIKKSFLEKFGIGFDDFMQLDLAGSPDGVCNPDKYLLYNDCFMGLFDCSLSGGEGQQYAECAARLAEHREDKNFGYLFASAEALCRVLEIKAELGVKTHEIYRSGDKNALLDLIDEYNELLERIETFHALYRKAWFIDNKPHGFDVQDIRIGGLYQRVKSCMERLCDYRNGTIDKIEELDEKQLDICGCNENYCHHPLVYNSWKQSASANVI